MNLLGPDDTWLSVLNVVGIWFAAVSTMTVAIRSINIQTKQKPTFKQELQKIVTVSSNPTDYGTQYALVMLIINSGYQPLKISEIAISFTESKEWLYGASMPLPESPLQHGDSHQVKIHIAELPSHITDKIKMGKRVIPAWRIKTSLGNSYQELVPRKIRVEIRKTIQAQ